MPTLKVDVNQSEVGCEVAVDQSAECLLVIVLRESPVGSLPTVLSSHKVHSSIEVSIHSCFLDTFGA